MPSRTNPKPTGVGGYWLTTGHIAELIGLVQSTIYAMVRQGRLNAPELRLGRTQVWDRVSTVRHLREAGFELKVDPRTLGLPKPKFDEGDDLLSIDEFMKVLGYNSRPEFQIRISQGLILSPDFHYGTPFPSYWLKSSIQKWLEADKPVLSYYTVSKGVYDVEYALKILGQVSKHQNGMRMLRDKEGNLKETPVIRWRIAGKNESFPTRKAAALSLIKAIT